MKQGAIFALAVTVAMLSQLSFGHGGRTNSAGCHNQTSNGTYHCHNGSSSSKPKRSSSARNEFRNYNPCPATGKTKGACPGWHVDHIVPLACGGADKPYNMQWLTAKQNLSKGSMGCSYD